jgi:hypothetical protein
MPVTLFLFYYTQFADFQFGHGSLYISFPYTRAAERTARGKISLAHGSHCCPGFLISFARPTSPCYAEHVYIYTYVTVYELPLLPNNTAVKHFYTNRKGAMCWLDIYRRGACLAVTGPIRDIGQIVLQSAFETGSSSSSTVSATFCCLSRSSRRSLLQI